MSYLWKGMCPYIGSHFAVIYLGNCATSWQIYINIINAHLENKNLKFKLKQKVEQADHTWRGWRWTKTKNTCMQITLELEHTDVIAVSYILTLCTNIFSSFSRCWTKKTFMRIDGWQTFGYVVQHKLMWNCQPLDLNVFSFKLFYRHKWTFLSFLLLTSTMIYIKLFCTPYS